METNGLPSLAGRFTFWNLPPAYGHRKIKAAFLADHIRIKIYLTKRPIFETALYVVVAVCLPI
jgi:hypothetical protein